MGDYYGAVDSKIVSENLTKVLYPNDQPRVGKELRLAQQYFFVSCSLQDMLRIYGMRRGDMGGLPEKFVVQLNDTHPAIGVVEMLRILVDELEERAAKMASGRLYLVDLAASESFETVHDPSVGKASPPAGDHFGLLALGKVLTALAGGRTHVPYREATLTKLLQQALP